jgi:hypothetical protein
MDSYKTRYEFVEISYSDLTEARGREKKKKVEFSIYGRLANVLAN